METSTMNEITPIHNMAELHPDEFGKTFLLGYDFTCKSYFTLYQDLKINFFDTRSFLKEMRESSHRWTQIAIVKISYEYADSRKYMIIPSSLTYLDGAKNYVCNAHPASKESNIKNIEVICVSYDIDTALCLLHMLIEQDKLI